MHKRLLTTLFLAILTASHGLLAQDPPAPATPPAGANLTVVTRKITPFVIEKNGRLTGFSIELWEEIVREAKLPFDTATGYKIVGTVPEMLEEVKSGRAQAGVAAVSITSEREQVMDFSYPFKESGLQILTGEQSGSSFSQIVGGLMKGHVLMLLFWLFVVMLLNAHIIWFLERKKNAESFPEGYVEGIWEAVWWSICTIITGGCENKAPLGVAGRLTAIVWMLAGAALFTYITATITSAMTVDNLQSDISSVEDLAARKMTVGTVQGSTADSFVQKQGVHVLGFPDVDAACAALAGKKVDAVIYDSPMLLYYAKNHPDEKLGVVGGLFEKQSYGIAMPLGSHYQKEITRAVLTLRENGFIDELEAKYFGAAEPAASK